MTDIDRLNKRRAYIKELLSKRESIDADEIVNLFGGSHVAVLNDISVVMTGTQAYKKLQTTSQNTRCRKLGVTGLLTNTDWIESLNKHDNACAICGSKENLAIDHIYPVSKNGVNTPENIQPLCKSCNSRKKDNVR